MFQNRLSRIAAQLDDRIDAATAAVAERASIRAKMRAPIRTGALKTAIHVERTGEGEYAVIAGNDNVFYGHIVEHGGVRQPSQPFLIPALEDTRGDIKQIGIAALKDL